MSEPALLPQAWRLARRELRGGLRGFGVFLACLFLGVFAIAAIGSFSAAARQGLLDDARALLGGDLELHLAPEPAERRSRCSICGTQGRSPPSSPCAPWPGRSATRTGPWSRSRRSTAPIPSTAASTAIRRGPWPSALAADRDGDYGALAEAALLQRLQLKVGDEVQVGEIRLRLAGVLTREPDRTLRGFSLGPRLLVSRAALAASGLLVPGSLVTYAYRLRLPAGAAPRPSRRGCRPPFPEAGWRLHTWREAAPRVRRILDRLSVNLTLVGLCALLIGGVGVAGAVRGYLAGKVYHIATMKCLGASGRTIFAGYLLQVLLLGALGAGAGLGLGAAVPWLALHLAGASLPLPLQPGRLPRAAGYRGPLRPAGGAPLQSPAARPPRAACRRRSCFAAMPTADWPARRARRSTSQVGRARPAAGDGGGGDQRRQTPGALVPGRGRRLLPALSRCWRH